MGKRLGVSLLNLHGTGLGEGGLPVTPVQVVTGAMWLKARDTLTPAEVTEEFGDLLFVMANLARHMQVDPEAALRAANAKFTRRFGRIESWLAEAGRSPDQSDLAEMDGLWDEAKLAERG